MLPKLFALLLLCSVAVCDTISYHNYVTYEVSANTERQKELLLNMSSNTDYIYSNLPQKQSIPTRISLPRKHAKKFIKMVRDAGMQRPRILASDLGLWLENVEKTNKATFLSTPSKPGYITLNSFHSHATVNECLDGLTKRYHTRVTVHSIGKSYENRDLKVILISDEEDKKGKKVIFVDAGIHAREWIAPAAALYIIYQLVENYTANRELSDKYDWVILPIVNPDGYEYSRTSDRLWSRTRQPRNISAASCIGADINRNFDFHWGQGAHGASKNPCEKLHEGEKALSEPETKALRDQLRRFKDKGLLYLSLHSFGKYLLYPCSVSSKREQTLNLVGQAAASAIRSATGSDYTVGSFHDVLNTSFGGSTDYAFAIADFPYAYTMELPSADVLPQADGYAIMSEEILPLATEAWLGILAMLQKISDIP